MTDTAEHALWRALNREPGQPPAQPEHSRKGWLAWCAMKNALVNHRAAEHMFAALHPADRLAYFEGKVRERQPNAYFQAAYYPHDEGWHAQWYCPDVIADEVTAPTEHLARFHAAARALNALGVIDDDVMKEISDGT